MSKLFLSRLKELQGSNSVSAFARYLEMPQKTVDTYIKEQRKPSVEFVTRVCSKCHVSADWLLGLSDQRSPFIEAPRENKVSKTPEIREKFPSFVRPVCRSVRQYYKDTTNGAEKQEQRNKLKKENTKMSQLTVKMQNGCVAIVDGSADEIVNVINKMMAENRIEQTIKDQVKGEAVAKRKPRNDIGIPRGTMRPFIPVNLTEDEILNNLKNEPEEPMKITKYLQCIGFRRYSSGTFGSEASRVLDRLEKVGVKFVRNSRNRKAICRDEQLKSLTFMIFKK